MSNFVLCPHGRTEPKFCIRCRPNSAEQRNAEAILPPLAGTLNNPEGGFTQEELADAVGVSKSTISGHGITWILDNATDVARWMRENYGAGPGVTLCQNGRKYFFSTDEDDIRQYRYTQPLHRAFTTIILTQNGLEPYLRRIAHNSPAGRESARLIRHHLASIIEVIQISQGAGDEEPADVY